MAETQTSSQFEAHSEISFDGMRFREKAYHFCTKRQNGADLIRKNPANTGSARRTPIYIDYRKRTFDIR